jgi:hypothetical protein
MRSSLSASGWPFHASHGSTILNIDPHREIIAIDIEGNVDVPGMQIRAGGIVKALDFRAS